MIEPAIILRALVVAAGREYLKPEQIPLIDVALKAKPAERLRVRKAFIRKYGAEAYFRRVHPILANRRLGGAATLFRAPATPKTRAFVEILAKIASARKTSL